MSNNIFKSAGRSAADVAKQIAKQVAREPGEILRETGNQVANSSEFKRPDVSVMQQVMTGDGKVKDVTPGEEQSIHAATKSRLQQIEAELRRLRQEREQRSVDYIKEQESLMGEGRSQEKPQYVEAPARPKHGAKNPAQRKQTSMETGKQSKG